MRLTAVSDHQATDNLGHFDQLHGRTLFVVHICTVVRPLLLLITELETSSLRVEVVVPVK